MSPSSSQQPPPLGTCAPARMHTMTGAQVQTLLVKLDRIWEALVEAHVLPLHLEDQPQPQHCDDNRNDWYTPGEVAGGGKHVCQEASILYHLQRMGVLDYNYNSNGSKNSPQDDNSSNNNHHHHHHHHHHYHYHPMEYVAVELGAGTGRLSDRLSRFFSLQQPQTSMQHVLVDRRTDLAPAQCRDRVIRARQQQQQLLLLHKRRDMGSAVQRVVLDIAHLDLANYFASTQANPSINRKQPRYVCMSKHLCGPACDLALDSLARYKKQQQQQQQQQPVYCALATCCHYLCSWQSFAAGGQSFWMALGLTQDDFQVAVAASQWASLNKTTKSHEKHTTNHGASTHGSRDAATASKPYQDEDGLDNLLEVAQRIGPTSAGCIRTNNTNNNHNHPPLLQLSSDEFERTFSRTQKATLGWKIKQLLDLARACHLQQMGYSRVKLVRYTSRSIDDRLLLAW